MFFFPFRKAVKAAILLMPLLGITNFIVLLPEPKHPLGFFIVSGIRRVLPTWQGFIISVIYYFMNKDVSFILFKIATNLNFICYHDDKPSVYSLETTWLLNTYVIFMV